ncbi:MAG: hypothetical protein GQ565_05005 [Candidatus Aegiribacteria sp.]|nr:hypothetical protein [Candidatus Aegiribacteria sp.]
MPACILLLRIRKFLIPLPWFLVWCALAPFVLLGWFVGHIGLIFDPDSYPMRAASQSWRILMLLMDLHGTEVEVNTDEENILIKFI